MAAALCALGFTGAVAAEPLGDALTASFKPKGQATLQRLNQDETQKACSTGVVLPGEAAAKVIADNTASIRYPAQGQYLGDWKNGDKIAQTGTGFQSSDDPAKPAGGNCYACHQLAEAEIAYGTIGPSLKQYGKLRGNGEAMLKYTWAKIYNAQAFMPCSTMPRFGHKNILTEQQIRDVMAFLFDPASPVNQ
ncbi:MAG: sulfur oxidation c-type cytochrome SoxX [Sinimarinibacterium sp.]|jgi:sulfur-oxidizing protein SoxX